MSHHIRYLPTVAAYDAWASTYDSDGNMLQKVDDLELGALLPAFLNIVCSSHHNAGSSASDPLMILDLGCGTGRNTAKLLSFPWPTSIQSVEVIAVDASKGMLDIARSKLSAAASHSVGGGETNANVKLKLIQHNIIPPEGEFGKRTQPLTAPLLPEQEVLKTPVNAVISTLVLEHMPTAELFFRALAAVLPVGGLALVTNMHKEMGDRGGAAGFVMQSPAGEQNQKVRGASYLYGVQETVDKARDAGLSVLDIAGEWIKEKEVTEELLDEIGERGRKWVGTKVWYGLVLKRVK